MLKRVGLGRGSHEGTAGLMLDFSSGWTSSLSRTVFSVLTMRRVAMMMGVLGARTVGLRSRWVEEMIQRPGCVYLSSSGFFLFFRD